MKDKLSQSQMILDYLLGGGKLTPMQALQNFRCFRLSARIHDLKGKGHHIKTDIITTKTKKRIACYSMETP